MPTCATCHHWQRHATPVNRPGWHLCGQMASTNSSDRIYLGRYGPLVADTLAFAGTGRVDGQSVQTAPEFGCVMWAEQ